MWVSVYKRPERSLKVIRIAPTGYAIYHLLLVTMTLSSTVSEKLSLLV